MTYGDLKIRLFFAYADRNGCMYRIPAALYFAVIDIANAEGCGCRVEPAVLIGGLRDRDFSDESIDAVLSVLHRFTIPRPAMSDWTILGAS